MERKIRLHPQINSDTIMLFGGTRPYARLFIQQKNIKVERKKLSDRSTNSFS
ncbi:MAG: hypothetical protein AB4080_00765 [Trichodesmium sp.]